jgi:hypothetical protein
MVAQAPANTSLPTPHDLVVRPDDQNAILEWNGGPLRPDQAAPDAVAGYQITWGPQDQPDAHRSLTAEQIIQLQPLKTGES